MPVRDKIWQFLKLQSADHAIALAVLHTEQQAGYKRLAITYTAHDGDIIFAYLLVPDGDGPFPGILLHHQHNGERHLGKSEVVGLVGEPLQAFGPVLARQGFVVLAPDSICFEDRRRNTSGIEPHPDDFMQHYHEMVYRLIRGDALMRKVLDDAAIGISVLQQHTAVNPDRIGILGHAYGGNTVLFQAALDERVQFACASGAACSYRYKMRHGIGLEMALVIPGFVQRWDIHHLLQCSAPRPMLIVSAEHDPFSQDADDVLAQAHVHYERLDATDKLQHLCYPGEHPLTQARFDAIVAWFSQFR